MSEWHFMACCKQDLIELEGHEFYNNYSDILLDKLVKLCSDGYSISRYPEDEELQAVINEVKLKYS